MKFENAYKGIRKIFQSEIMLLIATAAALCMALYAVIVASNKGQAETHSLILLVISGAVTAFVLFASVWKIIGIVKASKDEKSFKAALMVLIFGAVFEVGEYVLAPIAAVWGMVFGVLSVLAELFVMLFLIKGVLNLSRTLGDDEMVHRGRHFFKMIAVICLLTLIAEILRLIFSTNIVTNVISLVLHLISEVLEAIDHILFIVYLYKAQKMLV